MMDNDLFWRLKTDDHVRLWDAGEWTYGVIAGRQGERPILRRDYGLFRLIEFFERLELL
jgi:hypothetical protein